MFTGTSVAKVKVSNSVKIVKQRMSLSKDFKAPSFQFRREESSNKIRKLLKYFSFMFSVLCSKMMSKFSLFSKFSQVVPAFRFAVL